jgi:hypothetical protein
MHTSSANLEIWKLKTQLDATNLDAFRQLNIDLLVKLPSSEAMVKLRYYTSVRRFEAILPT